MPTFSLQHGATVLCVWDIDTGQPTFHERASHSEGILIVKETDRFSFVLSPKREDQEYRIFIGDLSLADLVPNVDDAAGVALAGSLFWRDFPYCESARGETPIVLEAQPEDSALDTWERVIAVNVYVQPSKLGEDSYQNMAAGLRKLSRSLLVDLYGKSRQTYDLRFAKEGKVYHSREEELESISTVLDRLGVLLHAIRQRPASRVKTELRRRDYWGSERLSPTAVAWLSRRGAPLSTDERPFSIVDSRRVEVFDIIEHRIIKAFLGILIRRAGYCAKVAQNHVREITAERHLRDIRMGDGPTLYESVDQHKIDNLEEAIKKAEHSIILASAMTMLPFLRDVQPELAPVRSGAFQRNGEYQMLWGVIRGFLLANAIWHEGDEMSAVTKLTSRLFEQWCYLQIVEEFRACGLDLSEWTDALRQSLQSRFLLDFDRGLTFEGTLSSDLRLRIRYEPWIFGETSATRSNETLCRGSSTDVAWCPDVVVECLRKQDDIWMPIYGIVFDCKYTSRIKSYHWSETSKYLEIRSTTTKRQVIRQLWLIVPGENGSIQSEDPAVRFDEDGPSCAPDEAVRFLMTVRPQPNSGDSTPPHVAANPFNQLAAGVISYLRREFSNVPGSDNL